MNALTRLWRRWFPAPPVPTAVAAPVEKPRISWDMILSKLGPISTPEPVRREYKAPEVLKGVRPETPPTGDKLVLAMDGPNREPEHMTYDNALPAAWGFTGTGVLGPGLAFLGFPYLAELVQISEYRIPSESLSTEMTRRWLKLKNKGQGGGKAEKIKQIDDRMDELKVRDKFREAALKTEQFGRAHIMANVKGEDDDRARQLPLTEIKKGTLLGFAVIEPYWLTPYSWNATHPERSDFYKPQSWYVLGRKTHASRLCTFIFREVPDLLKPAYDFAGISMTQLMMPYINRWLRTAKNVNDLINIFSIVTLATDLQAWLQEGGDKAISRAQLFNTFRDNRGMMVINKDTEELSMQNVPLSSLDKLQAQAQEHMAAPARMPLLKMFGITPSGLNATAEPEMLVWYDYVHALQELGFSTHFERILKLVQMDLFGTVDDDITFEWQPLYEPTDKEKAEMRKSDTERDATLIDKGVVSPEEVRDKIKREPESGYDNLKGEAPDPPEVTEFELGQQGAEADHERGEESAEAAHKRAKELKDAEDTAAEAIAARDLLRAELRQITRDRARARGAQSAQAVVISGNAPQSR